MNSKRAFTLVELLVVMTIMAIIAALVIPAFNGVGVARQVSSGADLIVAQFDLARQRALAENMRIELRFWNLPNETGSGSSWRAVQLFRVDNGQALGKAEKLPAAVVMLESPKFSSLLDTANPNGGAGDIGGLKQRTYKAVRISPDGSVPLDPAGSGTSNAWTVTVVPASSAPAGTRPAPNFATVQVDPTTGRTQLYRP